MTAAVRCYDPGPFSSLLLVRAFLHMHRTVQPLLDLNFLGIPRFFASVLSGSMFRIGLPRCHCSCRLVCRSGVA